MGTAGSARLFVALFAALAIFMFVNTRAALAQDDADSGTSDDANWENAEPTSPPIDESAASADKVLEIPQAKCANDDPTAPCDGADANNDGTRNDQTINAPSPGAPPQTFDDDTAYTAPDADWGTVDDYQNQQVYDGPYVIYPYPTSVIGTLHRPSQLPSSTFAPIGSPLTQAARPPLNQGPWMMPPTMSAFARPAGSPMIRPAGPMMMSAPLVGFHH
jgi:hypothetical protein